MWKVSVSATRLATGAHCGAPHPQAGFGSQGLQELQVGAPHPQGVSKQRAAVKTLKKFIMFFPGYQSSTIPQSTTQRVVGAQGLQEGAQVAGAQVAGAQVAGAQVAGAAQGEQVAGAQAAVGASAAGATSAGGTGASSAGAAFGSAGVGAAATGAGAQAAGAQAALAPQNPQLN